MTHSRIGATADGGIDRESLTEADRQGRDVFAGWAQSAGASVMWDDLGTMYATVQGEDPTLLPIAFGSHLDTQPTGGKFDGVLGVLGGLEVLRTLRAAGVRTRHPLCLVNWTAEEGGRFPVSMAASGVWAGVFPASDADRWVDANGVHFRDALRAIGYEGQESAGARRFRAWLELHIEQGAVLDDSGTTIGIVTGGQAMRFATVTISGRESHAGTTPMEIRLDPVSAFVRIATACEASARAVADGRFTVGLIEVDPGSHSVIPRKVTFSLDLRHPSQTGLDHLSAVFEKAVLAERSRGHAVNICENGGSLELSFNPACVAAVRAGVRITGYEACDIVSGAGHDAFHIARICPTAMIFIPCRGGISHNSAESITPQEAACGADVLLHAILTLDHN